MRSRAHRRWTSPLLTSLCLACGGGTANSPPRTADEADAPNPAEGEEAPTEEEASEEEVTPEPAFAEDARQTLRASEPPPNTLHLKFAVAQSGADLPWLVVIANSSETPVRVAADLRLLSLEIEPPQDETAGNKQTKSHVCELPQADRPSQPDRELEVELEPDMMLAHAFDPRLICEPDWLVPGAVVTPKFGWAPKTRTVWRQGKRIEEPLPPSEPYVAVAADTEGDPLAPIQQLVGEPFRLDAGYAPPPPPPEPKDDQPPPLELVVHDLGTIQDPRSATITVEIKNPASRGRHVFVRREFITYEVVGPQGSITCSIYPDDRVPDRQAFDFIAARGSLRIASRLAEVCPPGAFGPSGLYRIHARLDATESGAEQGLDAFVGTVTSRKPGLLRLRGGKPPKMWLLPIRPPGAPER